MNCWDSYMENVSLEYDMTWQIQPMTVKHSKMCIEYWQYVERSNEDKILVLWTDQTIFVNHAEILHSWWYLVLLIESNSIPCFFQGKLKMKLEKCNECYAHIHRQKIPQTVQYGKLFNIFPFACDALMLTIYFHMFSIMTPKSMIYPCPLLHECKHRVNLSPLRTNSFLHSTEFAEGCPILQNICSNEMEMNI